METLIDCGYIVVGDFYKSPGNTIVKCMFDFYVEESFYKDIKRWTDGEINTAHGFVKNSKELIIISHGTSYGALNDEIYVEKIIREFQNNPECKWITLICCFSEIVSKKYNFWCKDFPKLSFCNTRERLWLFWQNILTDFQVWHTVTISEEI